LSEDDAPQKMFSGDETAQKVFSTPHLSMAPAPQHFAFPQKVLPTDAEPKKTFSEDTPQNVFFNDAAPQKVFSEDTPKQFVISSPEEERR